MRLSHGALQVDVAPWAGGRIAQITFQVMPWLVEHGHDNQALIG